MGKGRTKTTLLLAAIALCAVALSCVRDKDAGGKIHDDLPLHQLRDGDLLFRCGISFESQTVKSIDKNKGVVYSHVGIAIKQGDIIGMHNGQIEFSGPSIHDVALETLKNVVTDSDELITVYFGSDVTEEEAEALTAELAEIYPDCDVEAHNGGQPLYYYLISVE